jgi:hypothetical protein
MAAMSYNFCIFARTPPGTPPPESLRAGGQTAIRAATLNPRD